MLVKGAPGQLAKVTLDTGQSWSLVNLCGWSIWVWCVYIHIHHPYKSRFECICVALRWRLKSPASRLFTQSFIQTQIKENVKAPRHWPFCGEFTGTGEFPAQRASYAEHVSIWSRHHVLTILWTFPAVLFVLLKKFRELIQYHRGLCWWLGLQLVHALEFLPFLYVLCMLDLCGHFVAIFDGIRLMHLMNIAQPNKFIMGLTKFPSCINFCRSMRSLIQEEIFPYNSYLLFLSLYLYRVLIMLHILFFKSHFIKKKSASSSTRCH